MQEVEIWALIPFAVMLLGIAVCPFIVGEWWEKNSNKLLFSLVLGIPTAIYLYMNGMGERIVHQMLYDYVPFITLLCALFVVTGGMCRSGYIEAKPSTNTALLAMGFVLASFIGTTGAAMLLVRMLIDVNRSRRNKIHTMLFFTAIVANCGGVLTPLGDPPLFLLYLRGVEFTWFLKLLPQWLFTGSTLLLMYYIADSHYYKNEKKLVALLRRRAAQYGKELPEDNREPEEQQKSEFRGVVNILYLVVILCAVAFINPGQIPAMGEHDAPLYMKFLREIVLVAVIVLSMLTTKRSVRADNHFTWAPIVEVAVLFIGIFSTMTPAMIYLNANAGSLGLDAPWQFYYSTGLLSSFLDNAPTAVAFYTIATGLPIAEGVATVAGIPEILMKAVSLGAVFFGSMTYIGNGPNFMIKSIAEENGIAMPSFFGYIFKFSLIVLLPVYVLVQLLFI
ncbi:MAG: sodium:proton antiporter [Rikenellaceae bacterium]|nr:sodium:proton antiporter [Rikenellaceae bacterium]